MNYQERPSNGSQDTRTAEKVCCSPIKMPFTMEKMTNKLTPFVRHAWIFLCMEYQENISNGTLDTRYSREGTLFSKQIVYIWECKLDI
jgi:hypothetical protein